jgi:hypothetical protein
MVLAIVLGIILLLSSGTAHAARATTRTKTSSAMIIHWRRVVDKAGPFVHMVGDTATIDPTIDTVLTADELKFVTRAVKKYNELPLAVRQHPHHTGVYVYGQHPTENAGAYRWTSDLYWWGAHTWINGPFAQNAALVLSIAGGTIGGTIGNIIGATVGAIIGAIIGAVAGSTTTILNNECGNRGVFIDINRVDIVPDVHRVC